jgi:putative inorganic carbon (HCO3(-)) transporter
MTLTTGKSLTGHLPLLLRLVKDWYWLVSMLLAPAFLWPGWWTWPVLAILVILWLVRWRVTRQFWLYTFLDWPIGLVLLGALVGLLATLDFALSANRAWSLVGGLSVYYAGVASLNSAKVARQGGPGLILAGVGIAFFSLLAADWGRGDLLKIPLIYDHLPHLLGLDSSLGSGTSPEQEINPRVVAGAMAMLVPVAWASALVRGGGPGKSSSPSRRVRIALLAGATFMTLILLLTQSPTAIGGILLAAGLFFLGRFCWQPGRRGLLPVLGGIFLALLILVLALPSLVTNLTQLLPPPNAEPSQRIVFRLEMWLRAIDMFADKPFTGIGLNNFPRSIYTFYPTYSLGPEAHAHNILLQTAIDGGIAGLAGFIAVLVGVIVTLVRAWQINQEDRPARSLLAGIGVGTLAWIFYGVGESITLGHKPALILWLMWGLTSVLALKYEVRGNKVAGFDRNRLKLDLAEASTEFDSGAPSSTYLPLGPGRVRPGAWLYSNRYSPGALGITFLVLVGLLIAGGLEKFNQNLVILEAQRAFLADDVAKISRSREDLRKLFSGNSSISAATLDLAAHLATRQEDASAATTYLYAEALLDSRGTVAKYIPSDWSLWKQPDLPASDPLLRLYNQWKVRYPSDIVSYARLGVAYSQRCQSGLVRANLQEGQSRLSSPASSLLQYLLARLPGSC